jgi:hypothetical protein
MAWQVLLVRLPQIEGELGKLPLDYVPPTIGGLEHVGARIAAAAKRACVTHESDGERLFVLRTEDFVIEAELGGVTDVDRVLLKVLGSDAALPLVGSLAQALDTAAIDCETDKVLDADSIVPDTLRQWQTRIDQLR